MPIFQDDFEQPPIPSLQDDELPPTASEVEPIPIHTVRARRLSEVSIRTDLCEGPIPDSPNPKPSQWESPNVTSDRAELIERLKRGESPTWIPNRHLESILNSQAALSSPKTSQTKAVSPTLLPAASIKPESTDAAPVEDEREEAGLNIERPGSALHTGDFTQDDSTSRGGRAHDGGSGHAEDQYPPTRHSWIATSPPRPSLNFHFDRGTPSSTRVHDYTSGPSSLSTSLSSSFVYKPPTSPLVQSESNEDVDLSLPLNGITIASQSPGNPRRHTLYSATSSPSVFLASRAATHQRHPSLRRETSAPYQAHQPRRSLNSAAIANFTGTSPQTPAFLRSRRPSFGSDTSPLQHAAMVGSYEESILRGRMSTTPSKPLDFLAQIGVLGLGKCKSSLRCPPHVTLPFPAVFYSYSSTPHSRALRSEDGPSPYVGQIDLENGLTNPADGLRAKRKLQSRYADRMGVDDDVDMGESAANVSDIDRRRMPRPKRRSGSPKAPPGGSYRIPEKGQVQIIIKNPNKTAVKLFLVPYDLAGMEPGTKTFIRQRSYSAGPILDNVPAFPNSTALERPILRYLVHLHICCPARGRFYLYKSIRVVFANRVPDGKETLRNETTWPEPRFTPYKPIRVMHPPAVVSSGPGANLAAEKAFRRRSSGHVFGGTTQLFDHEEGFVSALQGTTLHVSSTSSFATSMPIDPIPLRLPSRNRIGSGTSESTTTTTTTGLRSPSSLQASQPVASDWIENFQISSYQKLNKGDIGYGGNPFAPAGQGSPGGAEGLLSQRLRSLGVRGSARAESESDVT